MLANACGGSAPAPKTQEMVPANSASDPNGQPTTTNASSDSSSDDPDSNGASAVGVAGTAGKSGAGNSQTGKGGAGAAGSPTTATAQPMPQKIGGEDSSGSAPPLAALTTPQIHAAAGPKVRRPSARRCSTNTSSSRSLPIHAWRMFHPTSSKKPSHRRRAIRKSLRRRRPLTQPIQVRNEIHHHGSLANLPQVTCDVGAASLERSPGLPGFVGSHGGELEGGEEAAFPQPVSMTQTFHRPTYRAGLRV